MAGQLSGEDAFLLPPCIDGNGMKVLLECLTCFPAQVACC
jgi:hypothetical protein